MQNLHLRGNGATADKGQHTYHAFIAMSGTADKIWNNSEKPTYQNRLQCTVTVIETQPMLSKAQNELEKKMAPMHRKQ